MNARTESSLTLDGRPFRKATASSNGGGCVYLPVDGRPDVVADGKSGHRLTVPTSATAQLVRFARTA